MNGDMRIWRGLEDRRGHVDATKENATRPGRAWATYTTTGVGYSIETTCFPFGCSFVDMPIFTFGVVLDPTGIPLPTDDPPRCTAGVYDWKINANGFYAGAFCWFVVESFTNVTPELLKMTFTLAWEGMASKDFLSSSGFPVSKLDV